MTKNSPNLGAVTAAQMAEIDRSLEQDVGLTLAASTELTGYHIANYLTTILDNLEGKRILILTGAGHNGADALATARHLSNRSASVVALMDRSRTELKPFTHQQLELAEQYGVRAFEPGALLPEADLILDGLIGYGLEGSLLQESTRELIFASSQYKVPHIAIDVPTGLDATTGRATTPAFRADSTVTLGYPKTGLVKQYSSALVGELWLVDVGIPARWWQRLQLSHPDFSAGSLMKYLYN
jgi:NAD(P)H-hydrate epimerase